MKRTETSLNLLFQRSDDHLLGLANHNLSLLTLETAAWQKTTTFWRPGELAENFRNKGMPLITEYSYVPLQKIKEAITRS